MNFISVHASDGVFSCPGNQLPVGKSGEILIGFRGEDVELVESDQGLLFDVDVVEPMGSHFLLTGKVNGERVRISSPTHVSVSAGMKVGLILHPDRYVVMDRQTGKVS